MKTPILLVFCGLLLACGEPASQQGDAGDEPALSETERLNTWFAERNEERLAFSPIELTMLGRKDRNDQIDEMSIDAAEEQLAWHAASVEVMREGFDYEALDFEAKTSYDLWIYIYERARDNLAFARQEYIFEQMDGVHSFLPVVLLNYHQVDNAADMHAYISRIAEMGRALRQQLDWAKDNAEMGVRPPRFAYDLVIGEAEGLLAGAPFDESGEDSSLWQDAQDKIQALVDAGEIGSGAADSLRSDARSALVDRLEPAWRELIEWLQTDIANADPEPQGVLALPDGEAYYQQMLRSYTTTDLTAREIHEIGLAEVERLRGAMETIREEVNFEGSLQEFFRFVTTDDRFFYPDTDAGRQQYIEDTEDFIEAIEARLPDYFGILPQAELEVKRVEAFREQDGAPAHYYPSSPDGSVPGVYYIHLSDMRANPSIEMESTAYHEGLPGHHMQFAIALELDTVPEFRSQFFFNAYAEGWALYSELLAHEMGAYQDPYSNFGRLSNEMWRAVRLVVDTGLHAMGWSEQQAIDYFAENAATPLPAIVAEVRRYLVLPGQATSYKIGMLKIMELRERAEDTLGQDFDIREFHDVVLGGGSLPLAILEQRVDNYLAQKESGAMEPGSQ